MLSTPRRTAFPAAARATYPRPARASAARPAPPSRRAFQKWLKKSKNGLSGRAPRRPWRVSAGPPRRARARHRGPRLPPPPRPRPTLRARGEGREAAVGDAVGGAVGAGSFREAERQRGRALPAPSSTLQGQWLQGQWLSGRGRAPQEVPGLVRRLALRDQPAPRAPAPPMSLTGWRWLSPPPLPTVATTRVPTVHSLTPSLSEGVGGSCHSCRHFLCAAGRGPAEHAGVDLPPAALEIHVDVLYVARIHLQAPRRRPRALSSVRP